MTPYEWFELSITIAYLITVLIVTIIYASKKQACSDSDKECLARLHDKFLPGWIIIGILGFLVVTMLWIDCLAGNGWSCLLAVLWTLNSR